MKNSLLFLPKILNKQKRLVRLVVGPQSTIFGVIFRGTNYHFSITRHMQATGTTTSTWNN